MTPERSQVVGILKAEIEQRQQRNSAYSLRAFARDLGTSPAVMSLILQGKRAVTAEKAVVWADQLKMSGDKRAILLSAIAADLEVRTDPTQRRTRAMEEKMDYVKLQVDQFSLVSDWWHFGLMNLVKLKDFQSEPQWMATRLGIGLDVCLEALERLERLGLMSKESGVWSRTSRPVETPTDLPSEAIRSFHRQNIRRALSSIDEVEVSERDITSIMVATSQERLEEAKKRIRLFRKELAAYLEEGEAEVVYSLNVQLFPQTNQPPKDKI